MIEHGRKRATVVAALSLVLTSLTMSASFAGAQKPVPPLAPPIPVPVASAVDAAVAAPAPAPDGRGSVVNPASVRGSAISVSLFIEGAASTYSTYAATVGAFLAERGIVPESEDAVSPPLATPLAAGTNVTFRRAVPVTLVEGNRTRPFRSSAQYVREFLVAAGVRVGAHDDVVPSADSRLVTDETIRVVRVVRWSTRERRPLPNALVTRYDRTIPQGTVVTANAGRPGLEEVSSTFERRDDVARRLTLASRIVRAPEDRIVVHGIGRIDSFASIARTGFNATVRFAGQALSMVATAYTAACYGCSGTTATGQHAGHGIVAVDPSVIPLGTRLFIPGYGNAIAGDTGGAIIGHRIDLGFDSNADALQFGRRPITVYVLK